MTGCGGVFEPFCVPACVPATVLPVTPSHTGCVKSSKKLGKRVKKVVTEAQEKSGYLTTYLVELFKNHKLIKIFQRESFENERANIHLSELKLPDGVEMTSLQSEDDNDPAVVVIHKAKAVVEEEPVDAPEASEVASDQKNDENKDADKASDEKEAKDKE